MATQTLRKLDIGTRLLIAKEVEKNMHEIMEDPDFGLELRPEFIRELKKRARSKSKLIPLSEVKKRLGIK